MSARIGHLEQAQIARIMAALPLPVEVPSAMVEIFALQDPTTLYPRTVRGQCPRRLLKTASDAAPILREYEKLLVLARLFTQTASVDPARTSLASTGFSPRRKASTAEVTSGTTDSGAQHTA